MSEIRAENEGPELPLRDRLVFVVSIWAAVMAIYFAAGLAARPPHVAVATPLDDLVPFVPAAMAGYALVYVMPLASLFLERTEAGLRRMRRALLVAYALAAPFFLALPVDDADPPLAPATVLEDLLELNRSTDRTKNAFPSMHVGAAVVLTLIARRRSRAWGAVLGVATAVIVVSTLLVKQHFLVDLPAGALVGWIAFRHAHGSGADGPDPAGGAA